MSVGYRAVTWNAQKKRYDVVLVSGLLLYLATFTGIGAIMHPDATAESVIRALGSAAFLLVNIALCIGPLCRLDARFLPLLYNRRHLGVTTFLVALAHGAFTIVQFHSGGDRNPLVSLFVSNTQFGSIPDFPFELLGFAALIVLFLMAATSHDFWLRNLTAPTWKRLHMLGYFAYALLVAHVSLGALQAERNTALALAVAVGFTTVITLHVAAALKERRIDEAKQNAATEGFVEVCGVDDIAEKRGHIVSLHGERVAVFRYDHKISAVSNVCQHQNGPLGEGRIIDGCITCPWHGFQYLPESGASPAAFTEKVPTFQVRVIGERVCVHPKPNVPGAWVEPACITRRTARQEAV